MLTWIINWSLANRFLVLFFAALLIGSGLYSLRHLDIDAFPDTTPVQVQINTIVPALSPLEIEQQSSNLANLYVASYRLHGSVERSEVLQVIQEIIINLIGSEELGIYELDEKLLAALVEGMPPSGGNALGVDRLIALARGRAEIAAVMPFPVARL